MVENHIATTPLGNRPLTAVRPSEVQAWASDRASTLAPSTLRNLVGLLSSVFASAVVDRKIGTSPVVRIKLPDYRPERVVPLTVGQVRALADAVPARNRAMIITHAGLGLRLGELIALRLEDIDFLRRTVRIHFQRERESMQLVPPKTPRSRRTIPLPQVVADALAAHLAEYQPATDGCIFTNASGEPYRHHYINNYVFRPAVTATGLPESTTTHDLRHAYASWLLEAGESVVTVAERLGHNDATMVIKTYGHIMPNSEDRTRRAIDAAWASQPDLNAAKACESD
ncbi:site-specific integrase [Pseudonocardia sp.]|jgi:integrase|uniref:tyrosine-type recombinase/integrase n=1 Tax=Pseudonocardia sp. TaxID=60912 RepID=UPI0031FDED06